MDCLCAAVDLKKEVCFSRFATVPVSAVPPWFNLLIFQIVSRTVPVSSVVQTINFSFLSLIAVSALFLFTGADHLGDCHVDAFLEGFVDVAFDHYAGCCCVAAAAAAEFFADFFE